MNDDGHVCTRVRKRSRSIHVDGITITCSLICESRQGSRFPAKRRLRENSNRISMESALLRAEQIHVETGGTAVDRETAPIKAEIAPNCSSTQSENNTGQVSLPTCFLCGPPNTFFPTRLALLTHLCTDHLQEIAERKNVATCSGSQRILKADLSKNPNKMEIVDNLVHCKYCPKKFTTYCAYEVHKQKHRPNRLI